MQPANLSQPQPAGENTDLIIKDLPWYGTLSKYSADKFYVKLAADNNFDYQENGTVGMFQSSVAKMQGDLDIRNVITGNYHQKQFRLFTAGLTLKNIKGGWDDTIIEIILPHTIPHILITHANENIKESVSINNGIDLTGTFGSFSKVNTESPEFNKILVAHVQPNAEIEGLQILTPDIIEIFLNHASTYRDVEIVSDRFYVYLDGLVTSRKKLQPAFDFIDQIAPKLNHLSNDFV